MDRTYQPIMLELLDDVVTGAAPAGSWLPRLEDIVARHACSVGPVCEAVRAPRESGVLAVHAGRGQEVLDSDHWDLLDRDVLDAALIRNRDPQLLREAIDALRLYEVEGALVAAQRVTGGDLDELAQLIELMRQASR